MSKKMEFSQSVDLKQSHNQPITPDERHLINGDWKTTMEEMAKSTEIGKYVKTIEEAKNYAKVWLGLTPSYSLTWLLDTSEMEEMLKKVFKI